MLTKVQVFSQREGADILSLNEAVGPEMDLIQIRNIEGLDPVKAAIATTSFGSADGAAMTGNRIDTRNIVFTLHPNPDWANWTFEALRRVLYKYFMPKSYVKMIFYTEEIPPVKIYGYVEDCQPNLFSNDPEFVISVICPDPYFMAVSPTVLSGTSYDGSTPIDYDGDIEIGIHLDIYFPLLDGPTQIKILMDDKSFIINDSEGVVNGIRRFSMNSLLGKKYIRQIDVNTGRVYNMLPYAQVGYQWPVLRPGLRTFNVIVNSPSGVDWTLTYIKRYGGL